MRLSKLVSLLASILLVSHPAAAQTWGENGTTTPTWSSTVQWVPPYDTDSAHPADAYEPAVAATDNVIYNRSDWLDPLGGRSQIGTLADGTDPAVGGSGEAKFRTQCGPSFSKRADPILYPGQKTAGHGHTWAGWAGATNRASVESFSYSAGRANPYSTCDGGPMNATLYWEPSVYRKLGGVVFTVKPGLFTFYYVLSPAQGQVSTRLRRNLRFIGGADPMNFNDTARRKELADAGLQYAVGTPTTPAGFGGWVCFDSAMSTQRTVVLAHRMTSASGNETSTTKARYLKGPPTAEEPNGADPWGGACTAGKVSMYVNAPQCWNPGYLGSPNGRDHFRYISRKTDGTLNNVCPLNFAKVAHFETRTDFSHNGWDADIQHWWMASDRMRMATTECPDAAAPCDGMSGGNVPATVNGVSYTRISHDPCRRASVDFCSGATGHFDWWGAQDDWFMKLWQRDCVGIKIDGIDGFHADCGTGGFSDGLGIKIGGASPDTTWSPSTIGTGAPNQTASPTATGQKYFPVDPADQVQSGTLFNLHTGHGN